MTEIMPNKINLDLADVAPEIRDALSGHEPGSKGSFTVEYMTDSADPIEFTASIEAISNISPAPGKVGEDTPPEETPLDGLGDEELPPPSLVVIAGENEDAK